jgi:transcriptional/translational regulatory protein YebC/TACO1
MRKILVVLLVMAVLALSGCVSWMFDKKGVIVVEKSSTSLDEEELMMEALEAGADNFEADEEFYEITTAPEDFSKVREYLENKGITYIEAEIKMVPQNYMSLVDESAKKMGLIIEKMEDLDDVQEIWHNWDEEV